MEEPQNTFLLSNQAPHSAVKFFVKLGFVLSILYLIVLLNQVIHVGSRPGNSQKASKNLASQGGIHSNAFALLVHPHICADLGWRREKRLCIRGIHDGLLLPWGGFWIILPCPRMIFCLNVGLMYSVLSPCIKHRSKLDIPTEGVFCYLFSYSFARVEAGLKQ